MLRRTLAFSLLLTAACNKPTPWIYVSHNGTASISVFSAKEQVPSGIPQLVMRNGIPVPAGLGGLSAVHVLRARLYGTASNGTLQQFVIEASNGDLTATANVPIGAPPHAMVSSDSTLYVLSRGSADVRAVRAELDGRLTSLQTTPMDTPSAIDATGTHLYVGSAGSASVPPRICAHVVGTDGSFAVSPAGCVNVAGAVQAMVHGAGVLFVLSRGAGPAGPTSPTNWLTAFTISTTGSVLTQRGQPLDLGAANAGNIAISVDGRFLFVPRQGSFMTLSTADPLQLVASANPITNSQACRWPPSGAGFVLTDPRGRMVYLTDPIGFAGTSSNIQGPRMSALLIEPSGGLTPQLCEAPGGLPTTIAYFMP